MAGLGTLQLTFLQLQQLLSTQYAAVATTPASTSAGSALGAIFNANALAMAQLEAQAQYENNIARLATSFGADVDSFVNPFGIFRLVATESTGQVLFSTPSAVTANLVVPVGVLVQTASGLQFEVVPDATNVNYSSAVNGYTITVGNSSVSVTVQCQTAGTIGNVQAGTIVSFYSGPGSYAVAGVTTVNNASAFTNGTDPETDVALKARFALAMQTGSVATVSALAAAILGVFTNCNYQIADGYNATTPAAGYATIYCVPFSLVSSTAYSPAQIALIQAAVNVVKAAGVIANVQQTSFYTMSITSGSVKIAPGYTGSSVIAACYAAFTNYANNLPMGKVAPYTTTFSYSAALLAMMAVPGVLYISNLTLNSGTSDYVAGQGVSLQAASTLSGLIPV